MKPSQVGHGRNGRTLLHSAAPSQHEKHQSCRSFVAAQVASQRQNWSSKTYQERSCTPSRVNITRGSCVIHNAHARKRVCIQAGVHGTRGGGGSHVVHAALSSVHAAPPAAKGLGAISERTGSNQPAASAQHAARGSRHASEDVRRQGLKALPQTQRTTPRQHRPTTICMHVD